MTALIVTASTACLVALAATAFVAARRQAQRDRSGAAPYVPKRAAVTSKTAPLASFGARLRAEREARLITLTDVAHATKIKESLIACLERGDLSSWPHGVFRRGFVKEYAKAVGLDADRVAAELEALTTNPTGIVLVERRARPRIDTPRLTLDESGGVWMHDVAVRVLRTIGDAALVALSASLVSAATGLELGRVATAAALVCYPFSLLVFGETAASVAHRLVAARARRSSAAGQLRLVSRGDRPLDGRPPSRDPAESVQSGDRAKAASG